MRAGSRQILSLVSLRVPQGFPCPSNENRRMTVPHATWVLLARIVRPQGRRGEVLADIFTDFPEHFTSRKRLFLRPPVGTETMRETRVESHWLHKGRVVLKFSQVDSIADAENLRGFEVVIAREERMPLEGDAVY